MAAGFEIGQKTPVAPPALAPAAPTVSVVLLGGPDRTELISALTAGAPACGQLDFGLRVLHTDESLGRELGSRFPAVSWLTIAAGTSEAERRAVGFAASGTDIVLFVRPREMADPAWLAALSSRFDEAPGPRAEPTREWAARLAERGVPGALGDS